MTGLSGKVSLNRLAVVGTAIVCVLVILVSLLPIQVGISTDGMLSIGLRYAAANPDTGTFQPTKDTYLDQGFPTVNYGSQTNLEIVSSSAYGVGYNTRGTFEFDISSLPASAILTSATLSFYVWSTNNGVGRTYWVYKLTRTDWVEAQATWNIYKTGSNWASTGGDYVTSNPSGASITLQTTGWMGFNVLAIVQDARNSGITAEFLLKDAVEDSNPSANINVHSKEYTDDTTLRPKLVITYTMPSWLSGWGYRKQVTVTNAIASYQTKILVGESSGASGEEVDCGGKCQADFDDLRFTGSDGTTLLDYWIESITGTTPNQLATVWVENDATPSTTCYMYYGNSGASAASSGTNTFILFDDFERGNNNDAVGGIWGASGVVISTDHAYGGTRCAKIPGSTGWNQMYLSLTAGTTYAIRFQLWKENAAHTAIMHSDTVKRMNVEVEVDEDIVYFTTYTIDTGYNLVPDTWQLLEFNDFNWASSGTFDIWQSGTKIKDNAGMQTTSWDQNEFMVHEQQSGAGNDNYLDNFFVRKWAATEPTWGSWGSEETPTPSITNTPSSYDFGTLAVSTTADTGLAYFTLSNTGNCVIDVTIYGTDMAGGGYTWTLSDSATPGDMIYGMKAGLDGGDYTIIVKKTTPYNTLKSGLAVSGTQKFGLKLYTPTSFSDGNAKSGTITLTAACSS